MLAKPFESLLTPPVKRNWQFKFDSTFTMANDTKRFCMRESYVQHVIVGKGLCKLTKSHNLRAFVLAIVPFEWLQRRPAPPRLHDVTSPGGMKHGVGTEEMYSPHLVINGDVMVLNVSKHFDFQLFICVWTPLCSLRAIHLAKTSCWALFFNKPNVFGSDLKRKKTAQAVRYHLPRVVIRINETTDIQSFDNVAS